MIPPVWLHGDLHPANVLVDHGTICGVVDFGDLTAGDPATDLAVSWMLADAQAGVSLWDVCRKMAQHEVDEDLRLRARGWALHLSLAFLARSADNAAMHAIGMRTLAATVPSPS